MAETRCGQCEHYAELKTPFHYKLAGYPDGVTVYGFCGKNARAIVSTFFPVYLPDGGVCKVFTPLTKTVQEDLT